MIRYRSRLLLALPLLLAASLASAEQPLTSPASQAGVPVQQTATEQQETDQQEPPKQEAAKKEARKKEAVNKQTPPKQVPQKQSVDQPAAKRPVAKKLMAKKPAANKPAANKPAAKKSIAKRQTAAKPTPTAKQAAQKETPTPSASAKSQSMAKKKVAQAAAADPSAAQESAKEAAKTAKTPAKEAAPKPLLPAQWVNSLQWRSIGPANMSGRIPALAVYEKNPNIWWAASASGGLLKTINNGITFEFQFDREATVSIGDVQVAQSDSNIVWVGTGEANPRNSVSWGDGVYNSVDGGKTWKNMGLKKTFQIGRIAIHPKNPDIVYVGALGRLWGPNEDRGLYKTTDGGETWKKVLYVDDKTGVIDVQMNPKNPDHLIVATYERQRDGFDGNDPAKKFGSGSGVYVTRDGGNTFQKVTKGLPDCQLGRIGISIYRKDPQQVYLVLESERIGQVPANAGYAGIRGENADLGARLIEIIKDGPAEKAGLKQGDIVYRLGDKTLHSYRDLTDELDARQVGDSMQLTVSRDREDVAIELVLGKRPERKPPSQQRSRPQSPQDRARAGSKFAASLGGQVENRVQGPESYQYGGVYHSNDGGMSWERINSLNPRPMYYSQIRVDPSDNKNIWVLGTSLYLSKDGGKTFSRDNTARGIHVDHHSMWIDPRDGKHVILGNDGGVHVTFDQGLNWDHLNHVAIGQFYHVTVGPRRDYHVYGGLQDNGSWGGPHRGADGRGAINTDWIRIGGGDGFVCAVDPEDPFQIYSESQGGATGRYNLRTGERTSMRPRPPRGTRYRFNWKTPFILSPHNSRIYYSAGNYVFRSPYKGNNLQAISPEITLTDKGSASALAESPVEVGVLYVGTTDGAVWVTRNGGHEWTKLYGTKPAAKEEQQGAEEDQQQAASQSEAEPDKSAEAEPPKVNKDIVSGVWEGSFQSENMPADRSSLTLTLRMDEQGKIRASYKSAMVSGEGDGKFDPKKSQFQLYFETERSTLELTGTIAETNITGEVSVNSGAYTVPYELQRTGDPPPADASSEDRVASPGKPLDQLLPGPRWVSSIEASRFKRGRVYMTLDGHRSDDDQPYVFVSEDYGQTWISLLNDLPETIGTARVIREDVKNQDVLYLGTEFSIWISVNRGQSWTRLNSNLPTVAVHEIAVHPTAGEIVAGTHGRSLWVLDVAALRQLSAESIAADVTLYNPQPAIKWRSRPSRGSAGTRQFRGETPSFGASVYYSLAKNVQSVELQISDIEGRTLRELEGDTQAGLHRIGWDLRRVRPGSRRGGTVEAGKYLVTLIVDDEQYETVLTVAEDPGEED